MSEPRLTTMPGGERVVSERIRGIRSVAVGVWIGTGSRDEPDNRAGVSHFIEHLLFKGSSRYSAQDIAELFDTMGAELNAATSREATMVYTRVPDDALEQAVAVMLNMVFDPSFADLDSEREVVLEEIAMVEDNPQDLVHDLAGEAVFGGHPLGRAVIGRSDVIASVSRRALRAFHGGAYTGPNVVVSAAGNIAHDRLVELVGGAARAGTGRGKPPGRTLVRSMRPSCRFHRKRTEQYHVVLSGPGVSRTDDRRFALALLDAIVGGSASSRLFQEIREKRGMAYSVYSYTSQFQETGQVGIYLGTREDNLGECMRVTAGELASLAGGELRPGELERAKQNMRGRLLLALESTSSRMTRLGRSVLTDVPLLDVKETLRRVDAVTPDEIGALAHELFAPERLSVAGIGPSEKRFRAAAAHVAPLGAVS
ncbi:MAG: M16 family metallopeptidase [Gaiella sp.]